MKLSDLQSGVNVAPHLWQSQAPEDAYSHRQAPVEMSPDLERVLALPRRPQLDLKSPAAEAMVELEMRRYSLGEVECRCAQIDPQIAAGRRECLSRLLPMQAWMLREMHLFGGILAAAVAGGGKSLVGLMAPLALGLRSDQVAVLLVPPSLINQIQMDYELAAEHLRVPALTVHLGATKAPKVWRRSGVPTLHVLSFNTLSGEKNSDLLDRISPAAIICDEVDGFSDRQSARTIRLMRAFGGDEDTTPEEKHRRLNIKFCGWTGSLTDARLSEYSHLALLALRKNSPLPLSMDVTDLWGNVIDACSNPAEAGELLRLCKPGESVREGFARRVRETPGFIVAMDSTVTILSGEREGEEVGIDVTERVPPKMPAIIEEALALVRKGERPDSLLGDPYNEILVDPLSIARHAHTIAAGILLRWKFPKINGVPQEIEHIKKWYSARRSYCSEVREQISAGKKFLDSEKNCLLAASRYYSDSPKEPGKPEWHSVAYPAWRDISKSVVWLEDEQWLSPWLAEDAANWCMTERGICWYVLKAFGRRVAQLTGLHLHEGGPGAEERLRAEDGKESIICSIRSNGRGRNGLQFIYSHQLASNIPSSSKVWEQLMSRTVRRGQTEDVHLEAYLHTSELKKSFEQALQRGTYVEETLGARYKLNAGWRP